MIFFGVTRPGGNDLLFATPAQSSAAQNPAARRRSSLAKFKGRIHNHGAAPHDYFFEDAPGWALIFCGAHSSAQSNDAENSCSSLQADSGATPEGRIHNHEQLLMIFFE
jgi:hypothetical protein